MKKQRTAGKLIWCERAHTGLVVKLVYHKVNVILYRECGSAIAVYGT